MDLLVQEAGLVFGCGLEFLLRGSVFVVGVLALDDLLAGVEVGGRSHVLTQAELVLFQHRGYIHPVGIKLIIR